jgi:hypothetical protein
MHAFPQFLLCSIVLLYGLLFLTRLPIRTIPLMAIPLAWFLGWGVLVLTMMLLVVLGVYITPTKILLLYALWLPLAATLTKYSHSRSSPTYLGEENRSRQLATMFALAIVVIAVVVSFGNYYHYSTDSQIYEAQSRMFHKFGVYKTSDSGSYPFPATTPQHWLLGTQPLYLIVQNTAFLSGIPVFYSYVSLNTFFLLLGIIGVWREVTETFTLRSVIWLLAVLLLLLLNPLVVFHSFYSLTNLTAMSFFSFGTFLLFLYAVKRDRLCFLLGVFFLGCAASTRTDQLVNSLLPVVVLGLLNCLPSGRDRLRGFLLFFFSGYFWPLWIVFSSSGFLEPVGYTFLHLPNMESLGATFLLDLMCSVSAALLLLIPWEKTRNLLRLLVLIVPLLVLVALYVTRDQELAHSVAQLVQLLFYGKGNWGKVWGLLLAFAVIYLAKRVFLDRKAPTIERQADRVAPLSSPLDFLLLVTLYYFLTRIAFYASVEMIADSGFNDSGNRIMIQIFPVATLFVSLVGYSLSSVESWKTIRLIPKSCSDALLKSVTRCLPVGSGLTLASLVVWTLHSYSTPFHVFDRACFKVVRIEQLWQESLGGLSAAYARFLSDNVISEASGRVELMFPDGAVAGLEAGLIRMYLFPHEVTRGSDYNSRLSPRVFEALGRRPQVTHSYRGRYHPGKEYIFHSLTRPIGPQGERLRVFTMEEDVGDTPQSDGHEVEVRIHVFALALETAEEIAREY